MSPLAAMRSQRCAERGNIREKRCCAGEHIMLALRDILALAAPGAALPGTGGSPICRQSHA